LAQTYHMGALRSRLAIGEVQVLLNPVPVLVIVPTYLSMGGERGVSPASLILWTVVGITLGGGDRGGGEPPPRRRRNLSGPPHSPHPARAWPQDCNLFRGGGL
jgi:hypothetical protein